MHFLRKLLKKNPAIAVDDPVFGHITYEQGTWTFIPNPSVGGFMRTISAPESGPSQMQRDFFQMFRRTLPELEKNAREFMRSHIAPGIEVSGLSVYSVEIGGDNETKQQRFIIEMSDYNAIVIHRVSFSGSEAVDYGYDA